MPEVSGPPVPAPASRSGDRTGTPEAEISLKRSFRDTSSRRNRTHGKWGLLSILAALLAVVPFLPALGYPFLLEWDDGSLFVQNVELEPTFENLRLLFVRQLQGGYTPVTSLSFWLDRALFGLCPAASHAVNLLLYGATAGLLFRLFRSFRVRPSLAFAATLLWAWNPAQAEAVAWIAERKMLLAGFFGLAAMLLFQAAEIRRRTSWTAGLLLFAAMLAKPAALPLPGVILLLLLCRKPVREWRATLLRLTPLWLAAVAGIALTFTFTRFGSSPAGSAIELPGAVFGNFWRYLTAAIAPLDLNPIHPAFQWRNHAGTIAAGLLIALSGILIARHTRLGWKAILFFAFAAAAIYLPLTVSGLLTNADYADRYNYQLSALFWGFAAVTGERLLRQFRRKALPPAAAAAILLLLTADLAFLHVLLPRFSDTRLLFETAAGVPEPPPKALEGLGLVGMNRRDPVLLETGALLFFRHADSRTPELARVYRNTGKILGGHAAMFRNDPVLAARLLLPVLEAPEAEPFYTPEFFGAAATETGVDLLLRMGETERARRLLRRQLQQGWGDPCRLYFAAGLRAWLDEDREGARNAWESALRLRPDDPKIQANLRRLESSR